MTKGKIAYVGAVCRRKGFREERLHNLKGGCRTEKRLRDVNRGLRAETKKAHAVKLCWSNFLGPVLILNALREFRAFWLI